MPTEKAIAGKKSHNQNQYQNQYQSELQNQLRLQRNTGPQAGAAVGGGCVSVLKQESLPGNPPPFFHLFSPPFVHLSWTP